MIDRLHIHTSYTYTKENNECTCNYLRWSRFQVTGRNGEVDLTKVQNEIIQN
jgi:hypothetical protein